MHGAEASANTRKHHRIHPINESNSSANENQKGHTILTLSSQDDDTSSLPYTNQRTNSQLSTASSSIDVRASDVIKRITSPPAAMSSTDEILPQTFFRRMSASFNMNSLIQMTATPTSVLPAVHDVNSTTNVTEDTYVPSTTVTTANFNVITNECEICYSSDECENLQSCKHNFCTSCLQTYLIDKIRNGCPLSLECPHSECKEILHPSDIKRILNDSQMYERYERFMLRRVLQKIPDTRWCPYVEEILSF